jgi:hypothetical protein
VIDLLQAGVFHSSHDAIGVSRSGGAAVPGVDEQRLTGGCRKECGVSAFDVDQVDIERLASLRGRERHDSHNRQAHQELTHSSFLSEEVAQPF